MRCRLRGVASAEGIGDLAITTEVEVDISSKGGSLSSGLDTEEGGKVGK